MSIGASLPESSALADLPKGRGSRSHLLFLYFDGSNASFMPLASFSRLTEPTVH